MPDHAQLRKVLAAAVEELGGSERPGQVEMAEAVAESMADGPHLLVQAGTGTGKSLGYLVPALLHATTAAVVVATATLALQPQLVDRDIPRCSSRRRSSGPGGRRTRSRRAATTTPACTGSARARRTTTGMLVDVPPTGAVGQQVLELRDWAEQQLSDGERATATTRRRTQYQAWQQVAIAARECLGAQKCPYGAGVLRREGPRAGPQGDLVVTNHALLSIDAFEDVPVLPEHDVVVVDEAHELPARVTRRPATSCRAQRSSGRRSGSRGTSRTTRPTT